MERKFLKVLEWRVICAFLLICPALWAYSGGTGEPNDPYQIATAEDLIELGQEPNDYNECFVLTADIDLSGYVFDRAVIAADTDDYGDDFRFRGIEFGGSFDGQGHAINHLTIQGVAYLGLFGWCSSEAVISNLGLEAVDVNGLVWFVGGLVGVNDGHVTSSYCTGSVCGSSYGIDCIGGLVGYNDGVIASSYSTVTVSNGRYAVGGLVGENYFGTIMSSYSSGTVSGDGEVGALVGTNFGYITQSYSHGAVIEGDYVGGLVGENRGCITHCYSTGSVFGDVYAGGLVGWNTGRGYITRSYSLGWVDGNQYGGLVCRNDESVTFCLWDTETSGQRLSNAGLGFTSDEMKQANTYALNGWAHDPAWRIDDGNAPPHLAWESVQGQVIGDLITGLEGQGTADDPYRLEDAADLIELGKSSTLWDKQVVLATDIDLSGYDFDKAIIGQWAGIFDGQNYRIMNMDINGGRNLGFFGLITTTGMVQNLGVTDANVMGSVYLGLLAGEHWGRINACYSTGSVDGGTIGGLVGWNRGSISTSYSEVSVTGGNAGGLVGWNSGSILKSYSTGSVSGSWDLGGLVGENSGTIAWSYSTSSVNGDSSVGGLVGQNNWTIMQSYSTGSVCGTRNVGGLIGYNEEGSIVHAYSTGSVCGDQDVGGLVGYNIGGTILQCFWDTQTSDQSSSACGRGLTTEEMGNRETFVTRGWDFVDESANGLHETWQMPTQGGYPVLSFFQGYKPAILAGAGTAESPYLISSAAELGAMAYYSASACYALTSDIDLAYVNWSVAPVFAFYGCFDGRGHVISHLHIDGVSLLGLFEFLGRSGRVESLGIVDAGIKGLNGYVGGIAGSNAGHIVQCYSSGGFLGKEAVGGLTGSNTGSVYQSYSSGNVIGYDNIGGLVGYSYRGDILNSYSTSVVSSWGGASNDNDSIGGLVGLSEDGAVRNSFWDVLVSDRQASDGGLGVTTAALQDPETFCGWGDGIWSLSAGQDYPRLAWEGQPGEVISGTPRPYLGSGSPTNPYLIQTASDLYGIGWYPVDWDKTFALIGDIDLAGTNPNAWRPIGTSGVPFTGQFYGNGFSIDHFSCYAPGESYTGLFGCIGQVETDGETVMGQVHDVSVINATVYGWNCTAILAGKNEGRITKCHVSGDVRGYCGVGGLVGWNLGDVNEVSSEADVIGADQVNPLIGYRGPDYPY